MNNILTLETKKYQIKLENFEGPLDLLCYLVDKNKMDINNVNINQITDQYITYINKMEEMNLELTSEFLIMASTLLYIKSKSLLPKITENEEELTEEELINRIIDYKKYKEISKKIKIFYEDFSKRFCKVPEKIELPKKKIEINYNKEIIYANYKNVCNRNGEKINKDAINLEKIAILETVTVSSKVNEIIAELLKKPKIIFSKLCATKKYNRLETVTAFSGILEMNKNKEISTNQEKNFGEILIQKWKIL